MRVRPFGRHGVLVETRTTREALALTSAVDGEARLTARPGWRCVLVQARPGAGLPAHAVQAAVRAAVEAAALAGDARDGGDPGPAPRSGDVVEVPVVYDGQDLPAVAAATGLTEQEVVGLHAGRTYTVVCLGFTRGFPYLEGLDPVLHLPRRASPRPAVPAGSVAVAGAQAGIYPQASPGGWHLLGRTGAVLFDETADPPARLAPGDRVRFVPVDAGAPAPHVPAPHTRGSRNPGHVPGGARDGLRVVTPGPSTLVQDRGRPGLAAQGVGTAGAADLAAWSLGRRLVGNDAGPAPGEGSPARRDQASGTAGLEVLLGGLEVEALRDLVVAVTGARCVVTVDGRAVGQDVAVVVPRGALLRLGRVTDGLRAYVAVRGGLAVPAVLGSRSRDTLAGLGPVPLAAGDVLAVLPDDDLGQAWFEVVPVRTRGRRDGAGPPVLGLDPGPHDDVLDADGWASLQGCDWQVGADSDRVGTRLLPPDAVRPLIAGAAGDLPSLPVVPGCVQLTPSGEIVVLGVDAGVTGGYPVVGLVDRENLDVLSGRRPGTAVRLRRRP